MLLGMRRIIINCIDFDGITSGLPRLRLATLFEKIYHKRKSLIILLAYYRSSMNHYELC